MKPKSIPASQHCSMSELFTWCGEYHNWCWQDSGSARRQIQPLQRFAIGFYQIHQGIKWADTSSEDESFMAAAVHFACVAEALGLSSHYGIFKHYKLIDTMPYNYADVNHGQNGDWKSLIEMVSEAQQHVFYEWMGSGTSRSKSRYDPDRLGILIGRIVFFLISMVAKSQRGVALEEATEIMTGAL